MELNKKWEILLIHHTHTDIGYTQSQEVIESYHINFIKQAIEIAEELRSLGKENEFTWTCETFWSVESFLKSVDNTWRDRFEQCVKNGSIEITANYLNFNESIPKDILQNQTNKAIDYCKGLGKNLVSAMTADINGYGAGYAKALYECGVRNLYSCVHTHHGMYPLSKKQTPFYWQTKDNEKILVWNGEHYHFGNEFGIVGTATSSYINKDELAETFTRDKLKEYGEIRLLRYLKTLETEDYEYDFIPITIHGLPTDNASPNTEVLDFINWWNDKYEDKITIKLVGIEEFFNKVRNSAIDIPVHSGDWPDWWAFGVGSTPYVNKVYKEAQRLLKTSKLIDGKKCYRDINMIRECEDKIALYAEHTWGHSSSITNPWNSFVNLLDYKKASYAINAHEVALRNLNNVYEKMGMNSLKPNRSKKFKVINPHNTNIKDCVRLSLDFWEPNENPIIIIDNLGNEYKVQMEEHPRGEYINFVIELEANEERIVEVIEQKKSIQYIKNINENSCCQGIEDIFIYDEDRKIKVYDNVYETRNIKIKFNKEKGIYSWFDKVKNIELIDTKSNLGAFMPVYELTKVGSQNSDEQHEVRKLLGRNMRGKNAKVFYGDIESIDIIELGDVFGKIKIKMKLEGTSYLEIIVKIYNDINKAEANISMNKDSIWDPESIFISLPFVYNSKKMNLYADRLGEMVQLKKEQLPGTNIDFYMIQEGVVLENEDYEINIAMPDTSLIYTSKLEYEKYKKLFNEKYTDAKDYELYSWVMNNLWETNFKASLGGFIEFNYSIKWGESLKDIELSGNENEKMNIGVINYRVD